MTVIAPTRVDITRSGALPAPPGDSGGPDAGGECDGGAVVACFRVGDGGRLRLLWAATDGTSPGLSGTSTAVDLPAGPR